MPKAFYWICFRQILTIISPQRGRLHSGAASFLHLRSKLHCAHRALCPLTRVLCIIKLSAILNLYAFRNLSNINPSFVRSTLLNPLSGFLPQLVPNGDGFISKASSFLHLRSKLHCAKGASSRKCPGVLHELYTPKNQISAQNKISRGIFGN